MIQLLTGKYHKHAAWLLLLVFYGEFAVSLYAGNSLPGGEKSYHTISSPVFPILNSGAPYLPINKNAAEPVSSAEVMIKENDKAGAEKKDGEDRVNIGGPGQPEMNAFKSVGADNMVNLFSGDFSYNIPLLDVGGYPVNLFYNAGISMDQEASWTGLGWNINPGTINRNMRGLPDDYNGNDSIIKEQSIKPDRTIGVGGSSGFEIIGTPTNTTALGATINAGVFYNNRRGLGLEAGAGFDYSPEKMLAIKTKDEKTLMDTIKTLKALSGGLSANINLNSQNGMTLNAGFSIYKLNKEKYTQFGLSTSIGYSSRQGLTDLTINAETQKYGYIQKAKEDYRIVGNPASYDIVQLSFARSSFTPSIRMPITRSNSFYSLKLGKEKKILFKNGVVNGYIQDSRIKEEDKEQRKPAYGYMYYEAANEDENALLDFNRLNDGVYTYKTPVISVPVYTYDVFSISGEGTGGTFRGYRGNIGFVRDHESHTKSGSFRLSLDAGWKDIFHGGAIIGGSYSPSFVNNWTSGNKLLETTKFENSNELYQGFYFKNPGEKAIIDENYYNAVGANKTIRPYLGDIGTSTPSLESGYQVIDNNRKVISTTAVSAAGSKRNVRDKRTQVITYLTAEDASKVGLDKAYYSYTENEFKPGSCGERFYRTKIQRYNETDPRFYRKRHHLSEINVLEGDGRRYVYGLPVYQITQKEVSFSIQPGQGNSTTQQVNYNDVDFNDVFQNTKKNNSGRDGYFQSETVRGYAHSFLLTGILSPDYVDVTGDGITDDDLGTAIRFNYSRVNKSTFGPTAQPYWNAFKWRMPAGNNMANMNEGLKSDDRDNKGLYTYGEKELWYLHSIESKNMVATFYVSERRDGRPVLGENGGLAMTGPGQKKLDKINLYTKADYLKYGSNAKPVKTVHFSYDYSLCPDFAFNDGNPVNKDGIPPDDPDEINVNSAKGKLTLKAIWFSYNGNTNQVKNKYVFKYSAVNPSYNSVEADRWGTYKNHLENPEDMGNHDFPYTLQNPTLSNSYASAWNLEQILLPGGAVLQAEYEADDYAFVQDKRASQMTGIAGFGTSASSTPSNKLYTFNLSKVDRPGEMDHRFVFFDVSDNIPDKAEISNKYLKDIKQLLLKLWVKMPRGNVGQSPAYEPVIIYGAIKNYDVLPSNPKRFYIELEETRNGGSPIMQTVIQFLRDQLPQRAYPGYEVNGDGALTQVVRSVMGVMSSFTQGVLGFERDLKAGGKCNEVLLANSFARLNNPVLKKKGGGHRIKKITINDNWNRMTGQFSSMYGQLYDYTTTESINGENIVISSGVASYEPGIGNEENPFREVLQYSERQLLGPTDHSNIELPFAETFFPAPSVGYSRVSVRSIHNKDDNKFKSGIGLQQTEFYTTRDFPVISEYTDMDKDSRHHHKPGVIERVFNFNKKDYLTLTQGFRIVLNDMNGKLKSQTSYAENDYSNPVNYTANYYRTVSRGDNKYDLDNVLPVISGPDGRISNKLIGKDVEVMNDFREHFSYTRSATIPLNAEFFKLGTIPVLIPTIFRMAFRDESRYRSATTLKIVNEYGILDSVVNIDKGSVVSTKNMVYDAETGEVLVSRTNNEFKKPVYQFSYPAWWTNTGIEPAYRNIDLIYKNVFFRNGRIEQSPHVNMDYFESGDELFVEHSFAPVPESPGCIAGNYPAFLPAGEEYRIWAVDVRKDLRNTEKEFIFLDRYGNPYNATNATIRVIRSGKRNLTGASVGSIVSLANPVRHISSEDRVVIDDNTDVINATAAEFKERWRANDMFYAKDTMLRTIRQAYIDTITFAPLTNSHSLEYLRKRGKNEPHLPYHFDNTDYFVARQHDEGGIHTKYNQKTWLQYDFTGISADAIILSAKLTLFAHQTDHYFEDFQPSHSKFNPHVSYYQHRNDFRISRMFSSWPSTNAGWESAFNVEPSGDENQVILRNVTPIRSYQYISPTRDERIDVTRLVRGMIRDKFDPAKNYATGIKISLDHIVTVDKPARVCFWSRDIEGKANYFAPRIEVKYYQCSPSNPIFYQGNIENAPATPDSGYAFCYSDETVKLCYSVFSKKQMNPYVEGVLGNWRGWRSYVYYGERRESNPAVATDIRKDGVIKEYESFWVLGSGPSDKLTYSGSSKWVWNAEITQYNRKGAELENRDPLGRYNAGIYGYQESLPVAVINNSRLRLSAFDGFEDYFYKDDPCEPYCKPAKRHFTTGITTAQLDAQESHTGNYSVKINANSSFQVPVNVSADDTVASPDIRIKTITTAVENIVSVSPKGIGLKGYYYNDPDYGGTPVFKNPVDEYVNLAFRSDGDGDCKNHDDDDPPPGVRCKYMSAKWKGKIQVETTGDYEFYLTNIDDEGYVYINNVLKATDQLGGTHSRVPVTLTAGTLYDFEVRYKQTSGDKTKGNILLQWKKPGSSVLTNIPLRNLYPEGKESLADLSVKTETVYCTKLDTIQAVNHYLTDSFQLVPGKKMVASVWMKKGGQDCKCNTYTNGFAVRTEGGSLITSFVAKERIIEGWQQFEAVFTVPSGTSGIIFDFQAPADAAAYIDDLRIHPFNANMKSFVYDPVTLRLAAELDENNYASFYEYDDDGGLIRVKKETREGIKTITETRSAVQKNITDFQ